MLVGRCDLCQVDYSQVRMTVLAGSTDSNIQAGIAVADAPPLDPAAPPPKVGEGMPYAEGREITRVLLMEGDVSASARFIVDEWGWFQIGALHDRGARLNGHQHVCCKVKNVWRLPPYARRDDMEAGQPIIMLSGRWLGTRGEILRHDHGQTYHVKLALGGTAQHTLQGINGRHIGLLYKDDDPRNYETILPTPLRFYGGEFVSLRPDGAGQISAPLGVVEKGNLMTDGPFVVVWGTRGKGRVVRPIQDVIRVWTDEEREAFIRKQIGDD